MSVRALPLVETSMLFQLLDTSLSWGRKLSDLVAGRDGRTFKSNDQLRQNESDFYISERNSAKTVIQSGH